MFSGAAAPPGEGRPAWKILRVLGTELGLDGFNYNDVVGIRDELKSLCRDLQLDNSFTPEEFSLPEVSSTGKGLLRCGDLPAYKSDMLVRRARSLQKTADAQQNTVTLNGADLESLGLAEDAVVSLEQEGSTVMLSVKRDDGIPAGCAWLPIGSIDLAGFGSLFEPVTLVSGG